VLPRQVAVALVLAVVAAFIPSDALSHHRGDFFLIPRSLFLLEIKMEQTGQWVWNYEQECGQGNLYADVAGAMQDTEDRYGDTDYIEALGGQRNISTCAAAFVGACGPQAAACVGSNSPGYPSNCDAKYDGPSIANFFSSASRKSVVKHELAHCNTGRAEDYDDDQTDGTTGLRCIPSTSIMGCGPQHPNDYSSRDDALYFQRHYPPAFERCIFNASVPCVGLDVAGSGVYWCKRTENTRIVSVAYDDGVQGDGYWVASFTEATGDAFPSLAGLTACQGLSVELVPGRCVYVLANNEMSYPARPYWQLAGCV
jgi:hypothetical protein